MLMPSLPPDLKPWMMRPRAGQRNWPFSAARPRRRWRRRDAGDRGLVVSGLLRRLGRIGLGDLGRRACRFQLAGLLRLGSGSRLLGLGDLLVSSPACRPWRPCLSDLPSPASASSSPFLLGRPCASLAGVGAVGLLRLVVVVGRLAFDVGGPWRRRAPRRPPWRCGGPWRRRAPRRPPWRRGGPWRYALLLVRPGDLVSPFAL